MWSNTLMFLPSSSPLRVWCEACRRSLSACCACRYFMSVSTSETTFCRSESIFLAETRGRPAVERCLACSCCAICSCSNARLTSGRREQLVVQGHEGGSSPGSARSGQSVLRCDDSTAPRTAPLAPAPSCRWHEHHSPPAEIPCHVVRRSLSSFSFGLKFREVHFSPQRPMPGGSRALGGHLSGQRR